jgi:chemotaxis protein histidine kinase CheA
MRMSWLVCVLLGTLAWGQASAPAPPQAVPPSGAPTTPQPQVDTSASVPDNAAVITVNGVCSPQPRATATKAGAAKPATSKTPADCKTVITKAEFERLATAVAPNITPQLKKQLAGVLPRLIAMSNQARKQGLDKTPQFEEMIKFAKMQVLTNELQRKVQAEATKVPDADIEKYYKEHQTDFEQYNVDRLFIPRAKQVSEAESKEENEKEEKPTEEQQKAKQDAEKAKAEESEQAMTKLAEAIRARAAAGEDFAKLQKEAFDAAGMKIDAPTVNLPSVRRTGLPQGHTAAFDLKPGEVSQVISDTGGHYIYRLNSKNEMSMDNAKAEIHSRLQNDRMRERMEKLNSSFKVDTNEAYFGPGGAAMPPRPMRPRPGMPPSASPTAPQTPPPAQSPGAKPN